MHFGGFILFGFLFTLAPAPPAQRKAPVAHASKPFGSLLHVALTALIVFVIGLAVVKLGPIGFQRLELRSLSAKLHDPAPAMRQTAADRLAKIGPPAVPILLEALKDNNPEVRMLACSALIQAQPEPAAGIRAVVKLLKDDDPKVRRAAAWELGLANSAFGLEEEADETKETVDALRSVLGDKDLEVRITAVEALASLGRKAAPAGPDLTEVLHDRDPRLRVSAARTLLRINRDTRSTVVPVLLELLGDSTPESTVSQKAFGTLREEEAEEQMVPRLLELSRSPDVATRRRAVFYLGDIGPPAELAVYELLTLLSDSDAVVRFRAAEALAAIDPDASEPAIPILQQSVINPELEFPLRSTALALLAGLDPGTDAKAVPALIEGLHAKDRTTRAESILLLKQIGTAAKPALPVLTEIWRNAKDSNSLSAGEAIRQIDPMAWEGAR